MSPRRRLLRGGLPLSVAVVSEVPGTAGCWTVREESMEMAPQVDGYRMHPLITAMRDASDRRAISYSSYSFQDGTV